MHTFKGKNGTTFHFSSDFSGPVHISNAAGQTIEVDGADVEEFVDEIRSRSLEALEDELDAGEDTGG